MVQGEDYESCSFVSVLLEMGPNDPLGREAIAQLESVHGVVTGLAVEAGLRDPAAFARSCQLLINGSIVAAAAGDKDAALVARQLVQPLIDRDRAGL